MPSKIINKLLSSGLLKQSALYSIFNVLNAAIPFLLIPFLSRALTPQEYGIITLYTTAISFLMPFMSLNLQGAITNKFYSNEKVDTAKYIGNAIFVLIINMSFFLIVQYSISLQISRVIKFPEKWLWSIIVVCIGTAIIQIRLVVWQIKGKVNKFGIFQISYSLISFILTLFLIYIVGMKWEGRLFAHTLITVLLATFAIVLLFFEKELRFEYNNRYIVNAFKFGVPLIPHSIGGILIAMADKVLIANMLGLESAGIYGVGFQIGSILNILISAFNLAYVPWLFGQLRQNDEKANKKVVKITYLYFVGLFVFVGLASTLLPLINKFFLGEKFVKSYSITIWILLGNIFNGMYLMVTNYIFYIEKTYYLGLTTFIVGVFHVFLTQYLIKINGAEGAAIATIISWFICFIITWYISNSVYKMPWFNFKIKV